MQTKSNVSETIKVRAFVSALIRWFRYSCSCRVDDNDVFCFSEDKVTARYLGIDPSNFSRYANSQLTMSLPTFARFSRLCREVLGERAYRDFCVQYYNEKNFGI